MVCIINMSKMRSLFTYFFVLMAIVWGLYYILLFYGYEQGVIFVKVYMIYYIFLFVTVFFAIIFNSYTGSDDDEDSICYAYNQRANLKANTAVPTDSSALQSALQPTLSAPPLSSLQPTPSTPPLSSLQPTPYTPPLSLPSMLQPIPPPLPLPSTTPYEPPSIFESPKSTPAVVVSPMQQIVGGK